MKVCHCCDHGIVADPVCVVVHTISVDCPVCVSPNDRMPVHYGPWVVTLTDGDTAMHHEVYASTEEEAVAEVMTFSDYLIDGPEDEDDRVVTATARRVP